MLKSSCASQLDYENGVMRSYEMNTINNYNEVNKNLKSIEN